MIETYAATAVILGASLLLGRALLGLCGWPRPVWLSGAAGFAALVVLAPFLLRLPGRATTAAIVVGLLLAAGAAVLVRERRSRGSARSGGGEWLAGLAAVAIVLVIASLPFVLNGRTGILGEGIYTNDHAAQLYWADWLRNGFGPEPSGVRFGYPVGPQAVAVLAATVTASSLVSAFNGLLLAIPALTALTALAALDRLAIGRRIAVAAICGLPYLGASFLAQSAFKETAMGLFVLSFAIALQAASEAPGGVIGRSRAKHASLPASLPGATLASWGRGALVLCLLTAAAAVFTFSIPGLVWFPIGFALWLVAAELAGTSPIRWGSLRAGLVQHRLAVGVVAAIVIAAAAVTIGPATGFVSKIDDVQASAGRLSSPVFAGEALGIWPAGDFRIVRGEVSGSLLATALGALAIAYGALVLLRRRQLALLAMLVTGAIVYVGSRFVAEIHVQAKALAVIAPLVLLVSLAALLERRTRNELRATSVVRYGFGLVVLVGALLSTLLALRAAPIGYDDRSAGLEGIAERIDGESVAFLGVDRFAAYWLRGTLVRAPAGYVPPEIAARDQKQWEQGLAADFDTLETAKLDKFRYAITTSAAYGSTPPPNFDPVLESGDYVLWRRQGETPRSRVLDERGAPGQTLDCDDDLGARLTARGGDAIVLSEPVLVPFAAWDLPTLGRPAAAGQERGFEAPGRASVVLDLPEAGAYELSLQYQSQTELELSVDGELVAELPPSLDGMYLSSAGRGAFWPAGEIEVESPGTVEVEVRSADRSAIAELVGAQRRTWLGDLAASPADDPREYALADACERYVDHFALERGTGAGG